MRFLPYIIVVLIINTPRMLYGQPELDTFFEQLHQLQQNARKLQETLNDIAPEIVQIKPEIPQVIPIKPVEQPAPGKKPISSGTPVSPLIPAIPTVPADTKLPIPLQPGVPEIEPVRLPAKQLPTSGSIPERLPAGTPVPSAPVTKKPRESEIPSTLPPKKPAPSVTPVSPTQPISQAPSIPSGVPTVPGQPTIGPITTSPTMVGGIVQPGVGVGTGIPGSGTAIPGQPTVPGGLPSSIPTVSPQPLTGPPLPVTTQPSVIPSPSIPPPPPPPLPPPAKKPTEEIPTTEEGAPPPPPPPGIGVPPPPPGIGLPPPPPPLPAMTGTLGGRPGAKKVLTPLTPEELGAVDLPEQAVSDQSLIKTLVDAANPNLKTFKAYRDIWNNLTYQEIFKKRQELQFLLKFIDEKLKKKAGAADAEFLAPFIQQGQDSIPAQAVALVMAMLFNQQQDISFLIDRFVINVAALQRSVINESSLKESQKVVSDDLAENALKDASAQNTLNNIYQIFDHLRLQPSFLRFGVMVSTGKEKPKGGDAKSLVEELKQRAGAGAEGGPVITQPLLAILYDAAVPLSTEVEQGIKSLFFFPGAEFADPSMMVMIKAIVEDKRKQLAEKGTTKITLEQLTDTLLETKDMARLKYVLRSYPAIFDLFAAAQLSADTIIDALGKEFAGTVSNPLKKHLHNLIDPFIEQQRVARIFAQELANAIKNYDQAQEYQDASFYKNITEQTTKERSVKKVKEFIDYFTSLYRVEFEVWEKLKTLIGPDLLKEYAITDQKVFFLFAPYGMVLQLLSDFVKDGDFDILLTSLRGLNGDHASSRGLIRPEEPNYAPIIKEHKQRLSGVGIYKNKLMPIIRNFMNYDIVAALDAVTNLVDRAQLNIAQKPEYKQLLQSVRDKVLSVRINGILEQLQALNQDSPSVVIPGLPRPGAVATVGRDVLLRNVLMYEELAGKLTEFIKTIRDNSTKLATIDTATLADKVPWSAMQEHLKTQKDSAQGLQIVRDYINSIVMQITDLQKVAQAELTH